MTARAGLLLALWGLLAAFLPARADENRNAELGEISFFTGEVEIVHAFAGDNDRTQIGSKIYVNDVIRTGENSAAEIIFGINVRFRLEASGEIVIHDIAESRKTVDEVETVTRTPEILLRRGVLRARVRENTVNATPVLLKAGETRFFLPRSDFLLVRAPGDPSPQKMLECLLAWGKVEVRLESAGAAAHGVAGVRADSDFVNYQPGRTLVSEVPPDNTPPQWQPLPYSEAKKLMREKAPFSTDKTPSLPQAPPEESPELRGA